MNLASLTDRTVSGAQEKRRGRRHVYLLSLVYLNSTHESSLHSSCTEIKWLMEYRMGSGNLVVDV